MIGRDVKNRNYDKINLIEKTMNTTLLIMAAGIGSRFGTGIKQLEPVDASNHIIMDYSIRDVFDRIYYFSNPSE